MPMQAGRLMATTLFQAFRLIVLVGGALLLAIGTLLYREENLATKKLVIGYQPVDNAQQKVLHNASLTTATTTTATAATQSTTSDRTTTVTTKTTELHFNGTTLPGLPSSTQKSNGNKAVVLLTYQRSGSTFLGSLFNHDPQVFYVFEPLDALYTSLYGTEPGWNVPSDIVTFRNGTERSVSDSDVHAVASYLNALTTCAVDGLPTELLVHKFWKDWKTEAMTSHSYGICLTRGRLHQGRLDYMVRAMCGTRYGDQPPDRMEQCNRLLHDAEYRRSFPNKMFADGFARYRDRMDGQVRGVVDRSCLPLLKSVCDASHLRVVKTVRATMRSMQEFLLNNPDSYVIHQVRDPRAVALSRRNYHPSGRSIYMDSTYDTQDQLIREATIYCRQIVADVRERRFLERLFPGRVYSLTNEQLVADPVGRAADIYRFLGESPDPAVLNNFLMMSKSSHAKWDAKKWLDGKVTKREFDEIGQGCREMMDLYPEYSSVTPQSFQVPRPVPLHQYWRRM